jgi:signal peptide peptidase SppA
MPSSSFWSSVLDRLRPFLPRRFGAKHPLVPVVRLTGVIGAVLPFRQGLSISNCAPALERAFALAGAKAVAIVVNSPGGSAVQSHLIFRRIRALAEEKKLPVLVFVEDAAASGGYMIACAGDEIFADPSSVVGSIGVVSAGFGFDRLIERFGIERRVHTIGKQKAMLDPFRPEKPEDVERLKGVQARVFETFAGLVETRRGARLKGDREDLFSGSIWTGSEALGCGLIDGLGDLRGVLRERFGETVELRLVPTARPGLVARWLTRREPTVAAGPVGAGLVDPAALLAAFEERATWARVGL